MDAPPAQRRPSRVLDVLLVAALLVAGVLLWPRHAAPVPELPAGPWWGTQHDLLLWGPDAGEWANAARAVAEGRLGDVDPHRLPTWPLLAGLVLQVVPDVAEAGHLLNHLFFLLLPLVVYGLGRAGGGPGIGIGSAVLVLGCRGLLESSRASSADPAVAFMVPAAVLAAVAVGRRWWLAPLAGLVAALAATTHYTALPFVVPAALAVMVRGPRGWRRAAGLALHLAGAAAGLFVLSRFFTLPDWGSFTRTVSEGVVPMAGGGPRPEAGLSPEALAVLRTGATTALDDAVRDVLVMLRPAWLPWGVALVLPWLGVLGPGLGRGRGAGAGRVSRLWGAMDPGLGVVLLLCLAPLPVLAAAQAQDRYTLNFLPFAAILLFRGLASLPALADRVLGQTRGPWSRVSLVGATALLVALSVAPELPFNDRYGPVNSRPLASWQLAQRLQASFPPGGGAVCADREAAALAGRTVCPQAGCPFGPLEMDFLHCLAIYEEHCPGEGDIPFVVLETGDGVVRPMERWVLDRFEPLGRVVTREYVATVVAMPRGSGQRRLGPQGPPPTAAGVKPPG